MSDSGGICKRTSGGGGSCDLGGGGRPDSRGSRSGNLGEPSNRASSGGTFGGVGADTSDRSLLSGGSGEMAPPGQPLTCPEYLLIWAGRQILAGEPVAPVLAGELGDMAGPEAGEALLAAFAGLVAMLERRARRSLRFATPGSRDLMPDESQLLGLIAAAQHGQAALLEARLTWLVRPARRSALAAAVAGFAVGLAEAGIALPDRSGVQTRPAWRLPIAVALPG